MLFIFVLFYLILLIIISIIDRNHHVSSNNIHLLSIVILKNFVITLLNLSSFGPRYDGLFRLFIIAMMSYNHYVVTS